MEHRNPAFTLTQTGKFSVIDVTATRPAEAVTAPAARAGERAAPVAAQPQPPAKAAKAAKAAKTPAPAPAAAAAAVVATGAPTAGVDQPTAPGMDDLLTRRMFVVPAFEIYGGCAGFYDFGPAGCQLKTNVVNLWKRHFVLEEGMLEVECTALTPEAVLRASGHVAKFTDLMCRDSVTGQCHRADKLLEGHVEGLGAAATAADLKNHREADAMSPQELHQALQHYGITAPETGNPLTEPFPFNLMFETQIGPQGGTRGFLRPETAQGIFVNFKRLLECNAGAVPFAAAQVGAGYRNEISPRGGLLRVREFQMAEIEHFVHPERKSHPKFANVAGDVLTLFPNNLDAAVDNTMGEAVASGRVNNETLGYFMARTQRFALAVGLDRSRIRFRQHLQTEMAHYATDCWDLEVQIDGSWVECAGHSDRACYDLSMHATAANTDMVASIRYDTPQERCVATMTVNKKLLGKTFKKDQKGILQHLEELSTDEAMGLESALAASGSAEVTVAGTAHTLTRDMVSWQQENKLVHEEKYMPSVIEPSFGVGRIVAALFHHSYYVRPDDEQRGVMAFSPKVAPFKFAVFPLQGNPTFTPVVDRLRSELIAEGCATRVDASGASIGKRYARADELGVPFGVTVDFDTLTDGTVTLRERDSTAQVRIPTGDLVDLAADLADETTVWADLVRKYPSPSSTMVVENTGRGRFTRPAPSSS